MQSSHLKPRQGSKPKKVLNTIVSSIAAAGMFFGASPSSFAANALEKQEQKASSYAAHSSNKTDSVQGKSSVNSSQEAGSFIESATPTLEEILKNRYGEIAVDQYYAYYDELKKARTIIMLGFDHASDSNPAVQIKFGRCTGTYGLESVYWCLDKGTVEFKHKNGAFTMEDLEDIETESFTLELDGKSVPVDKIKGEDIVSLLVAVANGEDISEYIAINGVSLADFVSAGNAIGKDVLEHNLGTIVTGPDHNETHIPGIYTQLNFKANLSAYTEMGKKNKLEYSLFDFEKAFNVRNSFAADIVVDTPTTDTVLGFREENHINANIKVGIDLNSVEQKLSQEWGVFVHGPSKNKKYGTLFFGFYYGLEDNMEQDFDISFVADGAITQRLLALMVEQNVLYSMTEVERDDLIRTFVVYGGGEITLPKIDTAFGGLFGIGQKNIKRLNEYNKDSGRLTLEQQRIGDMIEKWDALFETTQEDIEEAESASLSKYCPVISAYTIPLKEYLDKKANLQAIIGASHQFDESVFKSGLRLKIPPRPFKAMGIPYKILPGGAAARMEIEKREGQSIFALDRFNHAEVAIPLYAHDPEKLLEDWTGYYDKKQARQFHQNAGRKNLFDLIDLISSQRMAILEFGYDSDERVYGGGYFATEFFGDIQGLRLIGKTDKDFKTLDMSASLQLWDYVLNYEQTFFLDKAENMDIRRLSFEIVTPPYKGFYPSASFYIAGPQQVDTGVMLQISAPFGLDKAIEDLF